MALKPWYKVVEPREDLREGRPLDASEFAVHLVPFPVTEFRDLSPAVSRSSWLASSMSPSPGCRWDAARYAN
jgi:hypothetical protein